MTRYVVATRREAQTGQSTAEDYVREIPGVWIIGGSNPHCITIEASESAAAEIAHRFGSVLCIEPEIRPQDQGLKALLASAPLHELELDRPPDFGRDIESELAATEIERQMTLAAEIMHEDRDILRALAKPEGNGD
jgi:hypothetical protein